MNFIIKLKIFMLISCENIKLFELKEVYFTKKKNYTFLLCNILKIILS